MALDYSYLTGLPPIEIDHAFTTRDTMLYALGVGAGATAGRDADDLAFVYEDGLKTLPTMAVVLAYPGFWSRDPKFGITWQKLLHVEQSIELHAPLPVEGRVIGKMTIEEIYDRGPDKGALMHISRRVFDTASGTLLATVRQVNLLRADGGFGGKAAPPPPPPSVPDRPPDEVISLPTSVDQALIYRLSGDTNPLHADPAVAKSAGFERPILHGLCSFGVVGRAVLKSLCGNDPQRLRRFDVRFTSPVYPGETLETRIWRTDVGSAAIEAYVVERGVAAMRNGHAKYDDA
ncbi:MAG: MaoC family dehydratase N-terminal domain-containing protein [Rhizobiaceae bacterium]|nr:MaoC family dehydratase N-terminal domain-containing protein [Rhizobiaceae bacterium]